MSDQAATATRREDPVLLTGHGRFSDDAKACHALHAAFVRSPYPHGRLNAVEYEVARRCPGVVAILTAATLAPDRTPVFMPPPNPLLPVSAPPRVEPLARDTVVYVGQPVALVLARSRAAARRAAELVELDVEPLEPVADFADVAPIVRVEHRYDGGAATGHAAASVDVALALPRVLAMAMEPRGMLVEWHEAGGVPGRSHDDACADEAAADGITVRLGTQSPSRARADIAAALGWDTARVRLVTGHVGGAFGARSSVCPEELAVALAAKRLRSSVCWTSTRSEDFTAGMHGRGARLAGTLWLTADGRFAALRAELRFALGAWLPFSAVVPLRNAARILPGPYRVDRLDVRGSAACSNAAPVTIYRGAGRPEAALLMETLVEQAARTLGIDPVALRRRNLVEAAAMPYRTPTGETFDSGDYLRALELACERFGYADERSRQRQRRAQGELVGIGLAVYVEPCGTGWESARVDWHADGTVTVASGAPAQGQGHETSFARIAADALGIDAALVQVRYGDTDTCPEGIGALASRSIAIGGSAIVQACRTLLARREAGEALPMRAEERFTAAEAWSYGCVFARMAIDRDTGAPCIERICWVDDAGHVVSPAIAQGQLLGGLAQGLGQALLERLVYDEGGQLLTGSLIDYAVPRADEIPPVEIHGLSTPSPNNLLGAKGVGEAGCIGVPAAVMNAAKDALSPLGERALQFPLTAEQLWRAITSGTDRTNT